MAAGPESVAAPLFPSLDSLESVLWPGGVLFVFVATAVLVDVMIILSTRLRMVDLPNRRSAHSLPTARGGGVALVLMISLATAVTVFRWPQLAGRVLLGLLIPGLVIAVVGIIDDLRPLRPLLRLFIQIAVAVAMSCILGPLRSVALPGGVLLEFGPFAWPLSILWIVGMINAFNFIDGSDGMAALGAVVAGSCMAALGFETRSLAAMLLAAFTAAAAGGFLVFNWQPARIFMGDVGSGFLGLYFAALPLLFNEPQEATFVPVVLCLWPIIYDSLLSVLRRIWNKQDPFKPHREFLFHRLIRSGVSHSTAAMLYALLAALGGLAGLIMASPHSPQAVAYASLGGVFGLAVLTTFLIERRCRMVGLPSAATSYSSALQ